MFPPFTDGLDKLRRTTTGYLFDTKGEASCARKGWLAIIRAGEDQTGMLKDMVRSGLAYLQLS